MTVEMKASCKNSAQKIYYTVMKPSAGSGSLDNCSEKVRHEHSKANAEYLQ